MGERDEVRFAELLGALGRINARRFYLRRSHELFQGIAHHLASLLECGIDDRPQLDFIHG